MIFISGTFSPARIIGLSASVFALVSCLIAWLRGRKVPHRGRLAGALAVLESAILLDMVFNGRWLLHDALARRAMSSNLYGGRSGPQHLALVFLGSAVAVGIGLALWRFRTRPGAALAACGGILSLCCWCIEVVSLHGVDRFLYSKVDGVMLVRLAWAAFSLMTGVGILWDFYGGLTGRGREAPPVSPTRTHGVAV